MQLGMISAVVSKCNIDWGRSVTTQDAWREVTAVRVSSLTMMRILTMLLFGRGFHDQLKVGLGYAVMHI
tara:strand:+ start:763 stop:969 length:207 start_codon:yes stop_codon:yes gene_type:complete